MGVDKYDITVQRLVEHWLGCSEKLFVKQGSSALMPLTLFQLQS